MTTSASLWPKDIETRRQKAPVAILKEQASILGEKTGNLVQGAVSSRNDFHDRFAYDFHIVSPPLDNYRFKLMTISYGINFYPLEINLDMDVSNEFFSQAPFSNSENEYVQAESEEEFLGLLKKIFGSGKTIRVITSLLSHADPDWGGGDWPSPRASAPDEDEDMH